MDASNFASTTVPLNGGANGDDPEIEQADTNINGVEGNGNGNGSGIGNGKRAVEQQHFGSSWGHHKAPADEVVDLTATQADLTRWPEVKKGYAELLMWLIFFGLYCAVLMIQLRVSRTYQIDEALRTMVVDEGGALQDVSTLGDFFDYLDDQIRPAIFPPDWYNGEALTTDETGFVLYYNMLVGGLLIVQERGTSTQPCRVPMYSGAPSSYQDFYETCYPNKRIEEDYTVEERANGSVPWAPGVPAPPEKPVNVLETQNDPALGDFYKSFVYSTEYSGFAAFLALADGAQLNAQKITALKQYRWLDKHTRKIEIKFALYNGMLQMFTFCVISFGFDQTGTFTPYNHVGGTKVVIKTIDMEPYLGNKVSDRIQIAMEIILVIWIFYQISSFLRRGLAILFSEGWSGKAQIDDLGQKTYEGGFKNFLMDKWTIIDVANYSLFVIYIVMRVELVRYILAPDKIIQVPANQYRPVLEEAKVMVERQLLGNFFNILLCLTRCFKFYRFQPRLAIINKTMETCFSDLYHFLLMFITFLFGFAVMSHILFGPQLHQFATINEALMTGWMMMNGASLNYMQLAYVDGGMAAIFFVSFMFLVFIILLNVLLAILVDSYALAKDATVEEFGGDEDNIPSLAGDMATIVRHSFSWGGISNTVLLQAVKHLREQDEEQATVDQIYQCIPEKVRSRNNITHEKILKNGGLRLVEEGEEHDEEHIEALHDPDLNEILAEGNVGNEVKDLLRTMDAMILENKQLRKRIDNEVASGRLSRVKSD